MMKKMIDMFSGNRAAGFGCERIAYAKNADMIGGIFSYFARAVPPCMVKLGGAAPLHSPYLTVDDEAIFTGAKLMAEFVF